jgi:hypothetical protein
MTELLQQHSTTSLVMEQQSWSLQIERSLQSVSKTARAQQDGEPTECEEGWQLIERALLMGAEVLKTMPTIAR